MQMKQGILERIETKLDAICTNMGVTFPQLMEQMGEVVTHPALKDTVETTNDSVDLPVLSSTDGSGRTKWDFTKLDKEGLPADERIHGKVKQGDEHVFKITTSGVWQKRRNLTADVKAPVVAELLAAVEAYKAAIGSGQVVNTGTTPPPVNAGTTPPPPPVNDDGKNVFINTINKFIDETGINIEVFMQYLSDTYGFTTCEQVSTANDRAETVIDVTKWRAAIEAARVVELKISDVYKSTPTVISQALQALYSANYSFSDRGNIVPSTCIGEISHDDIDGVAGVLEQYYMSIGQ